MTGPRTFVGSSGREDSPYAFFAEQPSSEEIKRRLPFVGPAGKEFDKQLDMAGIPRAFSYLSNILKDYDEPAESYIQLYDSKRLLRSPIVTEKGNFYLELLRREISGLSAKCIVAVGGIALWALTGRTGIRNWRGSILNCEIGGVPIPDKKVIGIYHPATVIPPKSQFLNRSINVHDMLRVKSIVEGTYVPTTRTTFIRPSFIEAIEYLNYCKAEGLKGARVSYDIEVFMDRVHKHVSCISFAINNEGMSIPFADHQGDYYRLEDEAAIWNLIGEILSSPVIRKCGQNLVFDAHFLLRRYGICMTNADDTMIAAKTLTPDYPIGLDFLTSWWTDQPYYKRDGKDFLNYGGAYETFWQYNALDSLVCSEIFPKQYEELTRQDNLAAYERQRLMIEPCCYMMEKGLLVDVDGMFREANNVADRIEKTQRDLEDIVGWDINPNSPTSLKRYFKEQKNVEPYKKRRQDGTWGDTYDETAMKRLARSGFREEANLILDKRRLVKQHSTYLDVTKIDSDNRLRCAYKPVGTRYSRLSSAENIFGTGGNQQNWPHDLQNFLKPDEGYVYYAFDLDQAENRIVAYVGEILNMMEVFEKDIDVHAKTARMLVRVFQNQDVSEDYDTRQLAPIGDGTKEWRHWGKKCVAIGTEVLTPYGWSKIEDWNYTQTEIAQWEKDGSISFVKATNCSYYTSDCIELSGRNLHVVGTPNHKMPLYRKDKDKFKTAQLEDITPDAHYGVPVTGYLKTEGSTLSADEAGLLVAFQADGSFNGNTALWRLKKERKIVRLIHLLELLSIPYYKYPTGDGRTSISIERKPWLVKDFNSSLLGLGLVEMDAFVNELRFWDGHTALNGACSYFSTHKANVEWAQTIAHLCGYTAIIEERQPTGWGKKLLYVMKYNNSNKYAILVSQRKRTIKGPIPVFGPEVPSGFFLIRSKGRISVTGNSNHGFNYNLLYKRFALVNEITEREGKMIYEAYHNLYPGVRLSFHTYVRRCLRENRTITNLLGRKTTFYDALNDTTYNEAYACIPQGSVGDIINERGIEFIYYNQFIFKAVEILRQVHDEIGFQIPLSIPWKDHAYMLRLIKNSLETPLVTHYGKEFVVPASLTLGRCLNKDNKHLCREIKAKNFPSDDDTLANMLSDYWRQTDVQAQS